MSPPGSKAPSSEPQKKEIEMVPLGSSKASSEPKAPPSVESGGHAGRSRSKPITKDPTWSEYVKVFKWETAQTRPSHTFHAPGSSREDFLRRYSISDIAALLEEHLKFKFTICLDDGSLVPSTMSIGTYLSSLQGPNQAPEKAPKQLPTQMPKFKGRNADEKAERVSEEVKEGDEAPASTAAIPSADKGAKDVEKQLKEDAGKPAPEAETKEAQAMRIFVLQDKGAFSRLPFRLKFVKKGTTDEIRGSVDSSVFDTSKLSTITMAHLRRMVMEMSARIDVHEFCLVDETPVHDNTLLSAYLGNPKEAGDDAVPNFTVFFHNSGRKSQWSAAPASVKPPPVKRDINLNPETWDNNKLTLAGTQGKVKDPLAKGLDTLILDQAKAKSHNAVFLHASELDEQQWQTVLRNCNLMHGWIIDLEKMVVRPAPKAAFQLRRGLNMPSGKDQSLPPLGEGAFKNKSAPAPQSKSAEKPALTGRSEMPASAVKTPFPSFTKSVARKENQKPVSESKQSVNEKEKLDDEVSDGEDKASKPLPQIGMAVGSITITKTGEEEGEPQQRALHGPGSIVQPAPTAPGLPKGRIRAVENALPEKVSAFPSFVVNDCSRVTVSLVSHELQESMAKNSFTSTSFEGEVSGGFKGIGIGVSGGASSTSQAGQAEVTQTSERKIIADFKFPRATLYLRAEDLEPTADLRSAIDKVKRNKNINDLRVLHSNFGHFFCHEAVIGGSLQTSRITSGHSTVTESRQKEDFKAQVGLAASSPKGLAGSMKTSRQKSTDDAEGSNETTVNDVQAFEATGGDAILASNPPEWCVSVLSYQNWRTIERANMSMLGTAVSQCADSSLSHVKEWFLEAVPHLSEYLSVPQSRVMDVRLKVVSDIPGLTDADDPASFSKKTICNYLGHQYGKAVHPIRMGVKRRKSITDEKITNSEKSYGVTVNDLTRTYKQYDVQVQAALFSPAQFQAPVLLQYEVPNRRIEMLTVKEYQETVWQIVVPRGEHLKHDSLVALRSYNNKTNLYLTVFRNAQGHFLPAITDSGDTPFWRVKKLDSAEGSAATSYIREADPIRLCWRFADQTCGFRDYLDDLYGRRRFTKPVDAPAELYLKTPFPGFERADSRIAPKVGAQASAIDPKTFLTVPQPKGAKAQDSATPAEGKEAAAPKPQEPMKPATEIGIPEKNGAAMIMSGDSGVKPSLSLISVLPHKEVWDTKSTYNLFDVTFRIDVVGNDGFGEIMDYMTRGLDQTTSRSIEKEIKSETNSWSAIDREKTRDTYVELGKQIIGHGLFGFGYTWLRKEFQPLSRALNL